MTLTARALAALPLLIVALFYGWVSRQWGFAAGASLALAISVLLRPRLDLGPGPQRLVSAAIGAAAIAAVVTSELPLAEDVRALKRPWSAATLAALAIAVFRLFLKAPERGPIATFAIGLLAATTTGETLTHRAYGAVMIAYLAASLLALRAQDPARPRLSSLSRRDIGLAAASLAVAALAFGGLARALPPLSDWTQGRILSAIGDEATTGFGDRMWLGSMEGMLQSDQVVMRVEGEGADYLRGAVYDHYERSRWSTNVPDRPLPHPSGGPAPRGEGVVQILMVGGARDRYFLPLGAGKVTPIEGFVTADSFGVLHTLPESALSVWFDARGGGGPQVAAVSDADLQIPRSIQPALAELAEAWTKGKSAPREKIEAIAERLRSTYAYSLRFESHRRDPVLNFLLETKKGHCEYFASALALLARAAGVPARVVIGYRVSERSLFGGYSVVRERNAHAWVEASLPGEGWVTFDATPAADLSVARSSSSRWLAGLRDLLGFLWGKARVAWAELSLLQIATALGAVVAVGLVVRWIRQRRRGGRGKGAAPGAEEPVPPAALRLFAVLEQRGHARRAAEPLERFAARLGLAGELEASRVLLDYAAFRYGGIGERERLLGDLDRCARELRAP